MDTNHSWTTLYNKYYLAYEHMKSFFSALMRFWCPKYQVHLHIFVLFCAINALCTLSHWLVLFRAINAIDRYKLFSDKIRALLCSYALFCYCPKYQLHSHSSALLCYILLHFAHFHTYWCSSVLLMLLTDSNYFLIQYCSCALFCYYIVQNINSICM